jgi:hypothetical protein
MDSRDRAAGGAARRQARERAVLIAAYREGLGFAAIVATGSPVSFRAVAPAPTCGDAARAAETAGVRWWCRRERDAERVCAAATARMRRRQSCDEATHPAGDDSEPGRSTPSAPPLVEEAIIAAAKKLDVTLYSDEDIAAEAEAIIARVEDEIERLRCSGQFKSVNSAYRAHRMEASARGGKVVPYAEWLSKYKANLVRQLAGALRYA